VVDFSAVTATCSGTFPFAPEDGPLHHLAFALAASGDTPSAAQTQQAREMAGSIDIASAIIGVASARLYDVPSLATAYEALALIQIETAMRRAAIGLPGALDSVPSVLDRAIAGSEVRATARDLFRELRRRIHIASANQNTAPPDLHKVLGRIKALREKTVAKGCTEHEALSAAEKMAELLDRYGLSLSDVELKNQICVTGAVKTGRKRHGPLDTCVPAVAHFCSCRVWNEKSAEAAITYVFFGMPADVAGAKYLYDLVKLAFTTETAQFRTTGLYCDRPTKQRRNATASFQAGLGTGISAKLQALYDEREVKMHTSTGRDLMPIKEGVVEDELAKLGVKFLPGAGKKAKQVLADAYHAGCEAGHHFAYHAGIEPPDAPT
jgi:Protein of unknown function (DUF2786)